MKIIKYLNIVIVDLFKKQNKIIRPKKSLTCEGPKIIIKYINKQF